MNLRRFALLLLFFSFNLPAQEKETVTDLETLKQGEVLTTGGYENHAVWGRMIGVIHAPPKVVWEIFVNSNEWESLGIHPLIDSRLVSAAVTEENGDQQRVDKFYQILGDRFFPIGKFRREGQEWRHYAFQYYDVPWPVANRWMVVKTEDDETKSAGGNYRARWTKVVGNVRMMEGTLELTRFEGHWNQTRLEYWVQADPGSHVPRFLIRWGVKRVMPAVIQAIRRQAEEKVAEKHSNSSSN